MSLDDAEDGECGEKEKVLKIHNIQILINKNINIDIYRIDR